MMKKAVLLILSLALTFTVSYIIFGFIFESRGTVPNYKPSITVEDTKMTQQQIAEKLMDERLKSFKSRAVSKRLRIKDYKIFFVYIHKQLNSGFVFTVDYSVKPAIVESDWRAGNGAYNEKSGWSESKFLFVRVLQEGSTFSYDEGATGGLGEKELLTPKQVIEEYFRWKNAKDIEKANEMLTERKRGSEWLPENLQYIKVISISSEQKDFWLKRSKEWAQRNELEPENVQIFLVEFEVKFVNDRLSSYDSGKHKWHFYMVRKNENSPWLIDEWAVY